MATSNIARNVVQTSETMQEVSRRISHVSDEARGTGGRAGEVSDTALEVAGVVDDLRRELVAIVRTAMPEINRRRYPRYQLRRPGAIITGGERHSVVIEDLSEGGLMISGLPECIAKGMQVKIAMEGIPEPLTAIVLAVERQRIHGRFELPPEVQQNWTQHFNSLVTGLTPLAAAA
jgi:hypothetical protein